MYYNYKKMLNAYLSTYSIFKIYKYCFKEEKTKYKNVFLYVKNIVYSNIIVFIFLCRSLIWIAFIFYFVTNSF